MRRASAKVVKRLKQMLKDHGGSMSVINVALAIPVAVAAGAAVDYARGAKARAHLQQAVDGAALAAGAGKSMNGQTNEKKFASRAAIAKAYLENSLSGVSDVTIVGAPIITLGPNTVDVTVQARVEGSLINLANMLPSGVDTLTGQPKPKKRHGIDMTVSSKIGYLRDSYICLLARHPTQREAIYFQGNSEFMANCAVQANSDNPIAIRTWGNAYAQADSFCAVGGWVGSGFMPDPSGGCKTRSDPYASLPLPEAEEPCTKLNYTVKHASTTLQPGIYCGGIAVSTHGVANFAPGLYIIKDGKLSVDSQSEINAPSGVVFYLTGNSSAVDVASGAVVTIVAPNNSTATPSTGAYKGFAIMQDRQTGIGNTNSISSKGNVNITGGIYTPNQRLEIVANGDMNTNSKYFPMIVDSFSMNGNSTLFVNLDYNEVSLDDPILLKVPAKVFVSR